MLFKILQLPVALIKDTITLGGTVNDAYFQNGNRSYTGTLLNQIGNEIKLKEELKTISSINKLINQTKPTE